MPLCARRYAKQHEQSRVQEVARLEAALRAEQDQRRRMRVAAARVGRGNFFEAMPRRMTRTINLAATHVRSSTHNLLSRRMTVRTAALPVVPAGVGVDPGPAPPSPAPAVCEATTMPAQQ